MSNSAQIDEQTVKNRRLYAPELFVNRDSQVELVAERVNSAYKDKFIASPIVNFWGVKGIGKTWLLHYINDQYHYQRKSPERTFTLFFTFEDDPSAYQVDALTRALATEVSKQLSSKVLTTVKDYLIAAQDQGDAEALVTALNLLATQLIPLILLDNTERVPSSAWEKIEQELLEPLLASNRTIVVIAGRRQIPRWRRFEVRRRVLEYERTRIAPLQKDDVRVQLAKSHYDGIPVDWLYAHTGGNPHLVDVLARYIIDWSSNQDAPEFEPIWKRHRHQLIQILRLAEDSQIEGIHDEELRAALYAVAVLRFYRLEALRFMYAKQEPNRQQEAEVYYLTLLRRLDQETDVVWWNRDRRAYVTSEVVRQVINRRRLLDNDKDFVCYHEYAYEMYWEWVREYPQASEDFIIEICFHLGNIYLAKPDGEELHDKILEALNFAKEQLNRDRLIILQNAFDEQMGDRELRDLLPEPLVIELRQFVGQTSDDGLIAIQN